MKYSYNWLKELSGTKKSPEQLAEILNLRAFEVEGIEKIKGDSVLEIKILADRGHDAMSHIGIAREICAIEGRKLKCYVETKYISSLKQKRRGIAASLRVKIEDKKLCPRYIGAVINNIKVKPSPLWMQRRLEAAGLRPINNIVDATNYVMLETGQPMHAFDSSKLKAKSSKLNIIIRRAKKSERIKLLDGEEKVLTSDDLVIANEVKALALAGIKGGAGAEISQNTKAIVLESANFNPTAIRKSRIRLGLKTDSSDRFEKGLDPNLTELAMARAVQIITIMDGKAEGLIDVYPVKVKPWNIKLNLQYVNKLLGENISAVTVKKILNSLELKAEVKRGSTSRDQNGQKRSNLYAEVIIPTFRIDLKTQEDLIEEIGRIYEYEKIIPQAPHAPIKMPAFNEDRMFERKIKNILAGKGFSEVYNYSFYSQHDANLSNFGDVEHLELENPMNPEQALMRVSLIPGILKNVRENLKYYKDLLIFESGRVYWRNKGILPEEKKMLVGAVILNQKSHIYRQAGKISAQGGSASGGKNQKDTNFYEAKSYCDALINKLGIDDFYYDTFEAVPMDTPLSLWHSGRSAAIKIEGSDDVIGYIGEINPFVLVNFDIRKRIAIFEFDLKKLQKVSETEREFEPLRKYPEVLRDISMIAPGNILVDEILQTIQKAGGNLVLDVDLFDIFDFADRSSSYAFHIIFGADNRTLKSGEVDKLMEKIINNLENKLSVKIRR